MAGTADHSSTDQTGPVARRPSAGRPRASAARPERALVSIEVGGAAQPIADEPDEIAAVAPIAPDFVPRLFQTQAAYRLLITSGFSGLDAAGLIGYVLGLPACNSRWTLSQVNRLLFLRNLYSNTDWGEAEREPA